MKRFIVVFVISFLHSNLLSADSQEFVIKAVFLEKFTNFVDWPRNSTVSDTTQPFTIGVMGDSHFGMLLRDVYANEKILKKHIEILNNPDSLHLSQCQMIFIPGSEKDHINEIINLTKDRPILTISDTEGFAKRGVMINLYVERNTVKFEVNETAIRHSPLKVSHLLLNLARIIK